MADRRVLTIGLMPRTPRRATAMAVLLATLTVVAACGGGDGGSAGSSTVPDETSPSTARPRGNPELAQEMTAILEAHRANREFVGAVLGLRTADGTGVTVTSGTKTLSGDSGAVDPDVAWGIGSATKMFVAVVVLQLAEKGRIDLDAGIHTYLPDLAGADRITPRQLLQHTSGLGEYLDQPAVQADAQRAWTPAELIAVAETAGRTGEPGGPFRYSNTNYVVLGEIIEHVTKNSWLEEVRERILEPLQMSRTELAGEANSATGYGVESGTFVDYTDRWHPSLGGATGGLQSTVFDLLVFAEALATGRLLTDRSQAQMHTFIPGEDLSAFGVVHEYGLGLEKYATEQVTAHGHMGNGAAHSAFIGFDRDSEAVVVVMMNAANPGPQAVMAVEALAAVGE